MISKPTSISGYGITDAYTKTEVDGLISSVYKPAGSVAYASLPTLASGVLGNVYNVTDAFTTDTRFVEGSGKSYPAGTNVVVVEPTSGTYKFDVLAGFVDLSGYVPTTRKVNNKTRLYARSTQAFFFYIFSLMAVMRISPATTRSSAAKPSAKLSEYKICALGGNSSSPSHTKICIL